MNILTDEEVRAIDPDGLAEGFARAVESAVLKKLAARDVGPFGAVLVNKESCEAVMFYSPDMVPPEDSLKERFELVNIYTESQLIAAQQKAVEACAKVVEGSSLPDAYSEPVLFLIAIGIRNGEWREYL